MIDSQMKRGIVEMCILFQFLHQDWYGYDIMTKMKEFFPEGKDSTFYVILRRLNAEGYTSFYYGQTSSGPRRKYYKITDRGKEYLANCIADWQCLKSIVESLGIN